MSTLWDQVRGQIEGLIKLAEVNDSASQIQFSKNYGEFTKLRVAYFDQIDKLIQREGTESQFWVKEARAVAHHGTEGVCVVAVFGFLAALIFGVIYSRRLSLKLSQIAEHVASTATHVATTSEQVSGSSRTLSTSLTQEAAALQETSASIEQLNAMVAKSSEGVVRSNEVAGESHSTASEGRKVVEDMIAAVEEINRCNTEVVQAFQRNNQSMEEISTVISEIGEKTRVINDIVFQTKLLSFNASVEAARAGEHGKGFAVVAEEVGNLAQMSGKAAQEISSILEGSIQKVSSMAELSKSEIESHTQVSTEKLKVGKGVAVRCGEVLERIVHHAASVKDLNGTVAQASQEQAQGIMEITKAMHQLDEATQLNSGVSQKTAAAATELSEQAQVLQQSVSDLMKIVQGKAA
jgi:methyl-accepting chemotaxis protein